MSATQPAPVRIEVTLQRLRETANQLRELQDDLYRHAMSTESIPGDGSFPLERVLAMEVLIELKASVDGLRRTLRAYIESLHEAAGAIEPGALSDAGRLQRVTEVLRVLRAEMNTQHAKLEDETFVGHIDRLITTALAAKGTEAA